MSPVGAIFVPFAPKTGTNMLHPRSPSIVELVLGLAIFLELHFEEVAPRLSPL